MQWHRKYGNINTNIKVKVEFTLHKLSATNITVWKLHVDESAQGRYDMILGRYIRTELGLNLKLSDHVIEAYDRYLKGSTEPMVYLGTYEFKYLNTGKIDCLRRRNL